MTTIGSVRPVRPPEPEVVPFDVILEGANDAARRAEALFRRAPVPFDLVLRESNLAARRSRVDLYG